jgi:hypothetical protein
LTIGSWKQALVIPALRLSLTVWRVAPPRKAKVRTCEPIQSGRLWVKLASA